MGEFALDTTGHFHVMPGHPLHRFMAANVLTWSDLDAFTQGYVEALFASLGPQCWVDDVGNGVPDNPSFSDLAPETLALILRDCADIRDFFKNGGHREPTREDGRTFWELRQAGLLPSDPPLRVDLGDDGKVYLREGQS